MTERQLNAVELAVDLIRFNTINGEGIEEECASYLSEILVDAGFNVKTCPFDKGRTSLVAVLGGEDPRQSICFTGHLDTVPLGSSAWRHDPFQGEIVDGRLYGRGSSDMKGGVAAFIVAALNLIQSNELSSGVSFIVTAGEEVGCLGAKDLVTRAGILPSIGALVIAEPTANYPRIGHKGALWLRARFPGVTAHSSMPEKGDNAVLKAARAALKLDGFQFNLSPHEQLGPSTVNVSTLHGGFNINSVADNAELEIDIRSLPEQSHERLIEDLKSCFEDSAEVDLLLDLSAMISDPEDPWIRRVFEILQREFNASCPAAGVSYFTDGSILQPALGGVPAIVLGPGEPDMAHKTDEFCFTERIVEATSIYESIIRDWNLNQAVQRCQDSTITLSSP